MLAAITSLAKVSIFGLLVSSKINSAAFGLPLDQRFTQLSAGFLLKDWMDNIDAIINGTSTLKYYAYSGVSTLFGSPRDIRPIQHDMSINSILIGLGMKSELIGGGDCGYAATIACELWEKDGEYFVKVWNIHFLFFQDIFPASILSELG